MERVSELAFPVAAFGIGFRPVLVAEGWFPNSYSMSLLPTAAGRDLGEVISKCSQVAHGAHGSRGGRTQTCIRPDFAQRDTASYFGLSLPLSPSSSRLFVRLARRPAMTGVAHQPQTCARGRRDAQERAKSRCMHVAYSARSRTPSQAHAHNQITHRYTDVPTHARVAQTLKWHGVLLAYNEQGSHVILCNVLFHALRIFLHVTATSDNHRRRSCHDAPCHACKKKRARRTGACD